MRFILKNDNGYYFNYRITPDSVMSSDRQKEARRFKTKEDALLTRGVVNGLVVEGDEFRVVRVRR